MFWTGILVVELDNILSHWKKKKSILIYLRPFVGYQEGAGAYPICTWAKAPQPHVSICWFGTGYLGSLAVRRPKMFFVF